MKPLRVATAAGTTNPDAAGLAMNHRGNPATPKRIQGDRSFRKGSDSCMIHQCGGSGSRTWIAGEGAMEGHGRLDRAGASTPGSLEKKADSFSDPLGTGTWGMPFQHSLGRPHQSSACPAAMGWSNSSGRTACGCTESNFLAWRSSRSAEATGW